MRPRDLYAVCAGLSIAVALQVIMCFLWQPTASMAALLVACLLGIVLSLAALVTAIVQDEQGRRVSTLKPSSETAA
jgi:cytochrome bd-type quinol oxidase subunit 1